MINHHTVVRAAALFSIFAAVGCSASAPQPEGEQADVAEDAITPSSPFNASYCAGAPIAIAGVSAHFAPGATHADLGRFEVEGRKRSCTSISGCGSWKRVSELVYETVVELDYSSKRLIWRLPATHSGTMAFDIAGGAPQLTLTTDPVTSDEDQYGTQSGALAYVTPDFIGRTFADNYSFVKMCDAGGPGCNIRAFAGSSGSFVAEQSGIVTKDCMRRIIRFSQSDAVGSVWTEYEHVWYGRF